MNAARASARCDSAFACGTNEATAPDLTQIIVSIGGVAHQSHRPAGLVSARLDSGERRLQILADM